MKDIYLAIPVSVFFVLGFFVMDHIGKFIGEHFRPYTWSAAPTVKVTDFLKKGTDRKDPGKDSAVPNTLPGTEAGSGKTLPPIL
jgi:hypothetical protein